MLVCHTGLLLHILLTGGVQGEDHTTGGSVGGEYHESLVGGDHGDGQSLVSGGDMTDSLEDFDSEPLEPLEPSDLDPLDLDDNLNLIRRLVFALFNFCSVHKLEDYFEGGCPCALHKL